MEKSRSSSTRSSLVKNMVKKVCKELDEKKYKSLTHKEVLESISAPELMNSKCLPFLYVYHKKKSKRYHLEKPFSRGQHVRLLRMIEKPLVVKWYRSGDRTSAYEISVYEKLKSLGCPLPYFSGDYLFWEEPVLVMEELSPLGKKEDIYKLGRQVLIQLSYLHTFGVHCDIKPDNILKQEKEGEKTTYFLIDFGGVAQEKLKWGYKRWIWSKHWTSQKPHTRKQIASHKHDFKELAYTMNALKNPGVDHREDFSGRLKKFMERVNKVDKRKVDPKDYEDLINLLS